MKDIDYTIAAAKAAGIDWHTIKEDGERIVMARAEESEEGFLLYASWDPLNDDADALALAAQIRAVIEDTEDGAIAICLDQPSAEGRGIRLGNDRRAARRFAIVKCAACLHRQEVAA